MGKKIKSRDFIQETIDTLKNASNRIEVIYTQFKNGEITKEEFEAEYHHVLHDWVIDSIEAEVDYPNNGCPYAYLKNN